MIGVRLCRFGKIMGENCIFLNKELKKNMTNAYGRVPPGVHAVKIGTQRVSL